MRTVFPVLLSGPVFLIALLLGQVGAAASPDDDEAVRDPRNFAFEGASSFDVEQLRTRLSLNVDIQVAGHLKNSLPEYLKQVDEVLVTGYRSSGFPRARAVARFDAKQRRVIVRVHEGPRYRCSQVRVTGLEPAETAMLVTELTQDRPPAFAVPVVVSRDDGTPQTAWETVHGSQVNLHKPVWRVDAPASFDNSLVTRVRKSLTQWFWDHGRAFPHFSAKVQNEEGSNDATLAVVIVDPGVVMTIGEIEIEGAKINSASAVLQFLEIRPGMPFDGRIESQLERRLWESGRFISARIKSAEPVRAEKGAQVNLTVVVAEHPKTLSLTEPLKPYQQALLKLRDWVVQWTAGLHDEDFVVDAQVESSVWDEPKSDANVKPDSPPKRYDLHVVMSPRNGQVISMQVIQQGKPTFAQTFMARDGRAVFRSPLTSTHLDLAHTSTTQLESCITLGVSEPKSAKKQGTYVNFWAGVKTSSSGSATPVQLKLELAPLAVLLAGEFLADAKCKSEAGILAMRGEGLEVRIDEKTGRLLSLLVRRKDLGTIRCRTAAGALQPEIDKQERLLTDSSNVYNAKRPESSLVVYAIGEYKRFCRDDLTPEQQESLAAVQKLCKHWSIEPVAELFGPYLKDNAWSPDDFRLPNKRLQWMHPALATYDADTTAGLAGYVLPIYRELAPRTGWFWPLGRDGLFALYGRPIGTMEAVGNYRQVVESGPIGHLTAALALAAFSPPMSQSVAKHALKRLSAKAFHADFDPLLAGDSWLGRNILSLAEALRQLDDSEIEALVRLLSDESHYRRVSDSLQILNADCLRPVRDVLPSVFEQLWRNAAKPPVETALKSLATGRPSEARTPIRDARIKQTSGTN